MRRLLLWLLLACPLSSYADEIKAFIHGVKGAVYTDSSGELRGKHHLGRPALITEVSRELMQSIGLKPMIQEVSLQQGQFRLDDENSFLIDVNPTETLKPEYKWVGPLQSDSVYFFTLKTNQTALTKLSDIDPSTSICVRNTTKHADLLKQAGFNNIDEVSSYRVCWDKLINGESILTTLPKNLVPTISKLNHDIAAQIVNTQVKLHHSDSYIAFPKQTPQATIIRWQTALNRLTESKDYQGLIHHFYCQQDCF